MSRNPECGRLFGWVLAGTFMLTIGMRPVSAAEELAAWHEQAETVHALLRADAARLNPVSGPAPSAAALPPAGAAVRSPHLALVELYGVGKQLTAIIEVDGVRKEYRPGASLPYGGAGAGREYRLIGLLDNCAVLRRGRGPSRSVCYRPAPEAGVLATAPGALAELAQPLPLPAR